jgi:hypothetical protein
MAVILPNGKNYFARVDGTPGSGYRLYTYIAGTSTPKVTYSDHAGTVPNSNPVIADSRGEMLVYWSGTYDCILKDENDVLIWGPETLEDSGGNLRTDLADSTSTGLGDALVSVKRTDLTNSVATTQHLLNKALPVYLGPLYGLTLGAGASTGQRTANSTAINLALIAAKAIGSKVYWPAGRLEYQDTLVAQNGVNTAGHGNMGETDSSVFLSTVLAYYGNSYAVDMLGATGAIDNRIQCCWSDFVLDCSNAGSSSVGFRFGFNQRSLPILARVTVRFTGGHGLYFADQNAQVSFDHVRLDECGWNGNKSGIYKEPAIGSSTWNAITFNNLQVENCGSSSSAAGAINLQSTVVNRGLYFNNCVVQGNKGTDDIFISKMLDLQLTNLYMEKDNNVAGQDTLIELTGCVGAMNGGYLTSSDPNTQNKYGIYFNDANIFAVNGVTFTTDHPFTVAGIYNKSSVIFTGKMYGATFANADTAAQWFGDYAPRVYVHKNGTNQTGIVKDTFTRVTFSSTEGYDLTGCFSSSIYKPLSIGTHHIEVQITWTSTADQDVPVLAIYRNGAAVRYAYEQASGSGQLAMRISADVDTSAVSDTIEIYCRHSDPAASPGSDKTISGAVTDTWFTAHLVGRVT